MATLPAAGTDVLSLEIPPDPAQILTVRMFAGAVARSLVLTEESTELLRLVVSEICADAIQRRPEGRITIDVLAHADPIRVTVSSTGTLRSIPADEVTEPLRRALIDALVPDAVVVEDPESLTVMFSL